MISSLPVLKALADETRLRLVLLLNRHELNVTELVSILDMGQPRISRHLKILADAELVGARRDGQRAFYSVGEGNPGAGIIEVLMDQSRSDDLPTRDLAQAEAVIRERGRAGRDFFEARASDWDRLRTRVLGGFELAQNIRERLDGARVVADLGCGSGQLLARLADSVERIIGVDSSPRMLDLARQRLDDNPAASLRIGELEHLPLRDGEADLAVLSLVLHHLAEPLRGLREAHRILTGTGRLMIVEFEKHDQEIMRTGYGDQWLGFDSREIEGWLNRIGFQLTARQTARVNLGLTVQIFDCRKAEYQTRGREDA